MRLPLTYALSLCLGFAACADHNGSLTLAPDGTEAPSNNPGPAATDPLAKSNDTPDLPVTVDHGQDPGQGLPGQGLPGQGSGPGPGTAAGSQGPDGSLDGTDGIPSGGQPVPEPSTLLLVGSGLAGLAMLRRRRRKPDA